MYIYIYIYIQRERERERAGGDAHTQSFEALERELLNGQKLQGTLTCKEVRICLHIILIYYNILYKYIEGGGVRLRE